MTLNGTLLASLMLIKNHKHVLWKQALPLVLSSFLGIPFGIYLLKNGNPKIIEIALGIVIITVAIYNLFFSRQHHQLHKNLLYVFGFTAGILGGAFNTSGPPIVIFGTLNSWTQTQFIGTLQGYFFPLDIYTLISQTIAGILTLKVLHYFLYCIPFSLLALLLGNKIRSKIPAGKFNQYVFMMLLVVGSVLLFRTLFLGK